MDRSIEKKGMEHDLLLRPRIHSLLEQVLDKPLVCVVAGPGCGKTTALKAFYAEKGGKYMILPLTALDNYATHFWEMFCQMTCMLDRSLSEKMKKLGFPDSLEKTNRFLHMLAEVCYREEQVSIIFDDLYIVTAKEVCSFISNLIAANIENLSVVLISRMWPELEGFKAYPDTDFPYITRDDLRFTWEETKQFLETKQAGFSEGKMRQIYDVTEGWPVAICLAGRQAAKPGGQEDLLEHSMPLISRLMEHEAFSGYSQEVRHAVLKLSLLDSFTDELVEIAAGEAAGKVTEGLRANMFVIYNPHTHSYSMQPFFMSFLKTKHSLLSKQEKNEFYEAAADWHLGRDEIIEAATYYARCRNYDKMWHSIGHYSTYDYPYGKAVLFHELYGIFPEDYLQKNPVIKVFYTHIHIIMADIEAAHHGFLALESEFAALPDGAEKDALLGEVYLGLAHTSIIRHSMDFVEYYKKAGTLLPKGSGIIDRHQIYVGTNNAVFLFSSKAGAAKEMLEILFDVMPVATKVMGGCAAGMEYLASAEIAYLQCEMNRATEYAAQAVERAAQKGQHDIVCNAYFMLVRIQFMKGNYAEVRAYMEMLRRYTEENQTYICHSIRDLAEGWFYIKIGHPEKVAGWILDDTLSGRIHAPIEVSREKVVKAEYLLANKKYHELLGMLSGTEEFCIERGLFLLLLKTRILKAVGNYRADEPGKAKDALKQAYEMAVGNDLIMHFVEQGNDMRALIQAVKRQGDSGIPDEWLGSIQTKASSFAKRKLFMGGEYEKETKNTVGIGESLSVREREVLVDLCQGLTREEIADNYNISVNTVKSILRSIYNKLGAVNRSDAVRIAMDIWFEDGRRLGEAGFSGDRDDQF